MTALHIRRAAFHAARADVNAAFIASRRRAEAIQPVKSLPVDARPGAGEKAAAEAAARKDERDTARTVGRNQVIADIIAKREALEKRVRKDSDEKKAVWEEEMGKIKADSSPEPVAAEPFVSKSASEPAASEPVAAEPVVAEVAPESAAAEAASEHVAAEATLEPVAAPVPDPVPSATKESPRSSSPESAAVAASPVMESPNDLKSLIQSGSLKNMTVSKLRVLLAENKLKTSGRKAELVTRLKAFARSD